MKKTFFSNHRFLCLSILFMWMKTYAVYKLGFDLQNNSVLEECLLLINPLSFIVPLFGIALPLTEKTADLSAFGKCDADGDFNRKYGVLRVLY